MKLAARYVLSAFLNQCSDDRAAALLQHLPEKEGNVPSRFFGDPSRGWDREELLEQIDPSWLSPFFRTLSENDMRLFLSSLQEKQRESLKKQLLFSNHFPTLAPLAEHFLRRSLLEVVTESYKELLPTSCLPDSPLNALLELKTTDLFLLIDLLGMHDLAAEIKNIIDKTRVKQLSEALSKEQLFYLKKLSQKKEPVLFKQLGLANWDGKAESLHALLYQRGLNRLAKGLVAANESLLWYVSRRLEIKAGEMLLSLAKPLEHENAHTLLAKQIEHLLLYFQYKNPL